MKKRLFVKAIGIMVSEHMYARIIHICDEEELAISEFIRAAIELKLCQEKDDNDNIITDN